MFFNRCNTVINVRNYLLSAFDRSIILTEDYNTCVSASITSGKRIISISVCIVARKMVVDCADNYFIFREPRQIFSTEDKCLTYLYNLTAKIRKELDM
jgi:hypothetical protein